MRQFNRWTILLGILVTFAGLALLAYMGFYNRYWGDDWCYNRDFKDLGVWKTVNTYFLTGEQAHRGYSTNRYTLTLFSGLFYLAGVFGTQIMATLIIMLWLAGMFWVISNFSKMNGAIPKSVILLGSAMLLYFNLYISTQRFQVLYWQAGVHYSFTLITAVYLLGIITSQMAGGQESKFFKVLIAPLAFLGGGLSEIGSVYLLAGITLTLMVFWYLKRKQVDWAVRTFPTVLMAFVFLMLAMIALIVSPSNSRYGDMSAKPTNLLLVPFLSFRYAANFIIQSFKSLPVPHVVLIFFFACLAMAARFKLAETLQVSIWKTTMIASLTLIVVWLLISAIQAPSVRFYSTPPDPRGQSLSRFTMLAGMAVIAWHYGQYFHARLPKKWLHILALAGILASIAYTARLIKTNYSELPGFIHRAELWDQRDADIKEAKAQGLQLVEVIVIDMQGIGVQDIMRSRDMEKESVITCGSEYYGVEAIKAISP
ncbi:MAG: hypothetical protein Q8L41_04025 [Anaerolineales bacterium]|nr:hypothetical protein [Anaerolineales bacterium]